MYVSCFAILLALSCKNEKVFVLMFIPCPLPCPPSPFGEPSLSGLMRDFRVYSSHHAGHKWYFQGSVAELM